MAKNELLPPVLSSFSLEDQQWINNQDIFPNSVMASDSESGSGGCKLGVKKELNFSKRKVNSILASFSYRSNRRKIARKLQKLFKNCNTVKEDHWLYIAQNYTPRAIYWVLLSMHKHEKNGDITIENSAAYFTFLIKKRKRRKERKK